MHIVTKESYILGDLVIILYEGPACSYACYPYHTDSERELRSHV